MQSLQWIQAFHFRRLVGMAFLIGMLVACQQSERLSSVPETGIILAFGDSLTYGTGVGPEASYPAVLEALTGRTVINAGVPGEVTAEGLKRLPGLLEAYRPDLLILIEGGNDMLRRRPETRTRDNLSRMVSLAKEQGVPVLLVGVPKPGLLLASADFYPQLADELGVPYVDGVLADILSDQGLKSDLIHPNEPGYRRLAEVLADFLRERGAL
ncbi:MAG: arylesterase [Methylohalobius sp. ZOD2]